jgi:hypothetical protein
MGKACSTGPRRWFSLRIPRLRRRCAGEEVGLLGTRWFIDHPVAPLSRITANLEIEMIGRPDSLAGTKPRGDVVLST